MESQKVAHVAERAKVSLLRKHESGSLRAEMSAQQEEEQQQQQRYEIRGLIAKGGLGAVFHAWDRQQGRDVALKRIRTAADPTLREARLQSALRHPNIVAVHDSGVDSGGGYIVMEFIQGGTLEAAISRGPMSLGDFDALARQTLAGLGAAHAQGILHLDLKPENIMLQPQAPGGGFQVKILDFGLARPHLPAQQEGQPRPQGIFGSVHYMAPEQFENTPVDARADIYALGCVFYHALTQQPPFQGDTSPQVIVAHRHHRRAPLATLRPDLPAPLAGWVETLLNRHPADRPANAAEALHAYESLGRPTLPAHL